MPTTIDPSQALAEFQNEVQDALYWLMPGLAVVEFPSVTEAPIPFWPAGRVWAHIYEKEGGHIDGARDAHERKAAEQLWDQWERWREDRQGQWRTIVAPAAWPTDDLQMWADWCKRLRPDARRRFEDRLQGDAAWWRRLVEDEQAWWQAVTSGQDQWLQPLLEESRKHRQKGFLGLKSPDEAWWEWVREQGAWRGQALEDKWQAHLRELAARIRNTSLRQEWQRELRAALGGQLEQLRALSIPPAEMSLWEARVGAQAGGVTYGEWRRFQEFWAQAGERSALWLLNQPEALASISSAADGLGQDAKAMATALIPVLLGLRAARMMAEAPALLVAALARLLFRQMEAQ